jgi:hypothetical protein
MQVVLVLLAHLISNGWELESEKLLGAHLLVLLREIGDDLYLKEKLEETERGRKVIVLFSADVF